MNSAIRQDKRRKPGKDTRLMCVDMKGRVVARQCTFELAAFVFQQWCDTAERNSLRYIQLARPSDPGAYREWHASELAGDVRSFCDD